METESADAQIKKHFTITCKKCNQSNIEVQFYAGYVHATGGDTGSLTVICRDCNLDVEIYG